jgi:hypothetical protein
MKSKAEQIHRTAAMLLFYVKLTQQKLKHFKKTVLLRPSATLIQSKWPYWHHVRSKFHEDPSTGSHYLLEGT